MNHSIRFGNMFSSFSVNDIDKAYDFYADTLGIDVTKESMGVLSLRLSMESDAVMIYPKADHQPATFTVLNLGVDRPGSRRGCAFCERDCFRAISQRVHRYERTGHQPWRRRSEHRVVQGSAGNIIALMEEGSED